MGATIPEFGHDTEAETINIGYTREPIELLDGLGKTDYTKSLTTTFTKTQPVCAAIGIASSTSEANMIAAAAIAAVISGATLTVEEEVSILRGPSTDFQVEGGYAPSSEDKLMYVTCCKWKRVRVRLEIKGKGRIPSEFLTMGDDFLSASAAITIQSGTDATTKIVTSAVYGETGVDLKITDVQRNEENEDWGGWAVTLEGWVDPGTYTTSPLKSSLEFFGEAGADLDGETGYKITIQETYSEDQHVMRTETVEVYDDAASSTVSAISYPA